MLLIQKLVYLLVQQAGNGYWHLDIQYRCTSHTVSVYICIERSGSLQQLNCVNMSVLLLLSILAVHFSGIGGLSCAPQHPQEAFCRSDFGKNFCKVFHITDIIETNCHFRSLMRERHIYTPFTNFLISNFVPQNTIRFFPIDIKSSQESFYGHNDHGKQIKHFVQAVEIPELL